MDRRSVLKALGLMSLMAPFRTFSFVNMLMLKKKKVVSGTTINLTISASVQNYNVFVSAGSPSSAVNINLTINSGIYVWSDDITKAALDFDALPSGSTVTITNNGYIMGRGGNGAGDTTIPSAAFVAPQNGGPAIRMTCDATIDSQNGYILGGGGGGGFGDATHYNFSSTGGGGAGGGAGGPHGSLTGPAGGTIGNAGQTGNSSNGAFGGGGGRVVPSTTTAGPTNTANALNVGSGGSGGGAGGCTAGKSGVTATGGSGGSPGTAGGNGVAGIASGNAGEAAGGGGGYGASGGSGAYYNSTSTTWVYNSGGNGGNALVLNGHSVTWTGGFPSTKVYGAVS